MGRRALTRRSVRARRVAVTAAYLCATLFALLPNAAPAEMPSFTDAQSLHALALLNGKPCGMVAQTTPAPAVTLAPPTPTPLPSMSPLPKPPLGPGQIYVTPFPTSSPVGPPPVPSATPSPSESAGPVLLVRPSGTPSISPAGPGGTPSPSPQPTGVPTLAPNQIAVLADKVTGSTKPGEPGDATGNVHIYYQQEVLVGNRAHYDGRHTITVTGTPYIVNNQKNSVLYADKIVFDTTSQNATLYNGRGESTQGVETGMVYFSAKDMHTDEHGVSHGDNASVTTCARPRSGYHVTGRTIDVTPGDKIVITKAVLWLGAAAVFFLPKLVIPLRTVSDERQKPHFFPEVGYNSYQGFYVKARLGFGHDQYYYGYYRLEFYTKEGIAAGYDAVITKKNGKRQTTIDFYGINDKRDQTSSYNVNLADIENFSPTLHGQFGLSYNSNFGPLYSLPPNEGLNAQVVHTTGTESQTYTYARSSIGSQSTSNNFGFTDTRTLGTTLQNDFNLNINQSSSNYGGFLSDNNTGTVDDILHWSNAFADYQLEYNKNYTSEPYGIDKVPEFTVRPYALLPHFLFPVSSSLTVGEYNEPQTPETTQRGDLNVSLGPALYKVFGSDFSANVSFDQYAYGTGDLKAAINQNMTLTTPIGRHIVNNITYTETNYNGPPFVPFQTMDQQPTENFKNAADVLRFFNSDYYDLSLNFNTAFDGMAQPISYQLTARPSSRSYIMLGGAFVPGGGQGFYDTNVQFSTPFGRGAWLQFMGDIDWKNGGQIINKTIYYSRIIGDCYQVQVTYNEAAQQVNVTLNLLAFPSHSATFGLFTPGSIIPTSLNGYGY